MAKVYLAQDDLDGVARALRAGVLACLPTETVYGIGVSVAAFDDYAEVPGPETGYGRIFTLKRRDLSQTVPWLVADEEALLRYGAKVPRVTMRLAERFWPGALTLVVDAADDVPSFLKAADGTIALRASASPVIQKLVGACSSPLAVTSANTHGAPAPISFDRVESRILEGVDVAVDAGETPCRDASTIVAIRSGAPVILREGALSRADIASVFE
ncbi:MAG: L-threonylcarbamoyladenylate synthase [Collinsella sp.]|nr:L-threonylcarbamoyladenylate synthase [Collinsella sp.]